MNDINVNTILPSKATKRGTGNQKISILCYCLNNYWPNKCASENLHLWLLFCQLDHFNDLSTIVVVTSYNYKQERAL